MTQICNICGAVNRPTARFCHQCGGTLAGAPAGAETALSSHAPAPLEPEPPPVPEPPAALGGTAPLPAPAPAPAALPAATGEADAAPDAAAAPAAPSGRAPALAPALAPDLQSGSQPDLQPAPQPDPHPDLQPVAPHSVLAVAPEPAPEPAPEVAPAAPATIPCLSVPLAVSTLPDPGEVLGGRYVVTAHVPGGALAEDRGVCRSCGKAAPLPISTEEPYCMECGAHLLDSPAPWPLRRLLPADTLGAIDASGAADTVEWLGALWAVLPPEEAAGAPVGFTRGVTLLAGQRSDVGLLRAGRPDEDSVFCLTLSAIFDSQAQPTVGLYFVADGMGGHGDGEIASRTACESLVGSLLPGLVLPLAQGQTLDGPTIQGVLGSAIQAANRRVVEKARDRANDMGTTLTLALVVGDAVTVANVGDSRTYLWQGGALRALSADHSAVYQLAAQGVISADDIYTHPRRNEIYRSLGLRGSVEVDFFAATLTPGDCLVLCCDGLWEMVRSEGIADVLLAGYGDPQTICDELIRRANQAGGEDNISVIVVRAQG